MNPAEVALRRASNDLDHLGISWALVGGFAIAARVEPRFTRDVDVAVAVETDDEAEGAVFRLSQSDYQVGAIVESEATGRLATARLWSPVGDGSRVFVDLLFSSSGIETEIVRYAERTEVLPGLSMPVAQVGHLIAVKLLATSERRPQDTMDLELLRRVATGSELARARAAVVLIMERGTHRGRDLIQAFDAFASASPDQGNAADD